MATMEEEEEDTARLEKEREEDARAAVALEGDRALLGAEDDDDGDVDDDDHEEEEADGELGTAGRKTSRFPVAEELWTEPEDGVARESGLQGVELWFIRHGESINNAILHRWGGLGTVLYPVQFEQDPRLTTKGRAVAALNGARLVEAELEFDLVLSSAMIRTMETAHEMFVKSGIVDSFSVVPFMSEIPLSWGGLPIYENIPRRRSRQLKIMRRDHGDDFVSAIDWSLVGGPEGSNMAGLPPAGSRFLAWLGTQASVRALVDECRSDEVVRIAIVTHSNLMKRDLELRRKPGNSDIWKSIIVSSGGQLELENIVPWYRGDVERKKVSIDRRIGKRRAKAQRKLAKYRAYAEEVQKRRSVLTREAAAREEGAQGSWTDDGLAVGSASYGASGIDGDEDALDSFEDDDNDDIDDDDDDDDNDDGRDKKERKKARKLAKSMRRLSKKGRKLQEKLQKIEKKTTKVEKKTTKKVTKLEAKKLGLDTYEPNASSS